MERKMSFYHLIKIRNLTQKIASIFGSLFFLAFTPTLYAATYYVNAINGNDENTGLIENFAWKTIAKVNTISFQPGDRILFMRNQSWTDGLSPRSSGISGQPIVFGAYGKGSQPIIGTEAKISINVYNKSYITIENIELKATERGFNAISDSVETKYGLTIQNCKIVSSAHGIYLNSVSGRFDTISITNNLITPGKTSNWQVGINFVSGISNFIIYGNTINPAGEDGIMIYRSDNGIVSGNTGGGNGENTIDIKNSHHIVIADNICSDDGEANIVVHEIDDNHIDSTSNIIVENNICKTGGQGDRLNQGYRVYSGIYVNFAKSSIVRYNWVEQAFGSGIFMQDLESKANLNQIYGNVILNCGTGTGAMPQGGIELGDCVGTKVYNNTIYNQKGTGGIGIYIAGGQNSNSIEVKNNIVHTAEGGLIKVLSNAKNNFISDHNCFYSDKSKNYFWDSGYLISIADWKAKSLQDIHSFVADPQFINITIGDFRLTKGSPCINKGAYLGVGKDFNEIMIPQGKGPDIGAFEFLENYYLSPPKNFCIR
jgi:hypothetical protein